jgi:hypothetical protein
VLDIRVSQFGGVVAEPAGQVGGEVDVSGRSQVVARHRERFQSARPLVRNAVPGLACQQEGMAALASVRGRDDLAPGLPPGRRDAVDRLGRELGPVREHDHGGLGVCRQCSETATQRRAGTPSPVGAPNGLRGRVDGVRAQNDDDAVDGARSHALEDGLEQEMLLRGAEPSRSACSQNDGCDVQD